MSFDCYFWRKKDVVQSLLCHMYRAGGDSGGGGDICADRCRNFFGRSS